MPGQLIDTDVLIDHFRGARAFRPPRGRVGYSIVTRCELFAGKSVDEAAIGAVLAAMQEYAVDRTIAERAGRLRRRHGIRTPDALIAATAVEHDLTLVTRNLQDFKGLRGLRARAPA
jgi:predicted nucleic acid-binding protein